MHYRWQRAATLPRDVMAPLVERYAAALDRLVSSSAEAFRGTEFDLAANRARMEQLCARVEGLLAGAARAASPAASPAEVLAAQLREALAANTIGGRVDEDARWRAAADEVRRAQEAWDRIGPVPPEAAAALHDRFSRACRRVMEQRRRPQPTPAGQRR
jgi:hypothetical protein